MDFDLNKCVWVRTIPEKGRETREKEVVSHGIKRFVRERYDKIKKHAPCRVFIDPFGHQMLFVDPTEEVVKRTCHIDLTMTVVEVVKHDSNGPMMVVNRYHMLCFRDEVDDLLKQSSKNAAKAREDYLANLILIQQLKADKLNSDAMLDHIGPGFVENLEPNPGDKVEMYSFKDDIPINPTN